VTKRTRLSATDPDLAGALAALKRASAVARRLAISTGTPFYVMENGRVVDRNTRRRKRVSAGAGKRGRVPA
jgi:hypothetical protein